MAQAAQRHDPLQPDTSLALPESNWSGDVHGPVAALHQAIEDRFLVQYELPATPFAEPPVEALVRHASRATGWLVLAAAFVATIQLIA